ncbi:MAG TPA: response regulator [Vicinamibacterales bacterium]|nr:response regulator [Vicinamibacterales bacterium]
MPYSVLVVDQHPVVLATWIAPLLDAGYEVAATTSFEEARQRLAAHPPNLLIASSRLGGFNGIHLVLCAHVNRSGTTAIVTTPAKDPILEADASVFGASCVVAPEGRAELLAVVTRALSSRPM